jgi:hypothetical protein
MKVTFDMIADPVARERLGSLDFHPDVAERLALELLELVSTGGDLGSVWTNFEYDEGDGNRVVGYDITELPTRASKPVGRDPRMRIGTHAADDSGGQLKISPTAAPARALSCRARDKRAKPHPARRP